MKQTGIILLLTLVSLETISQPAVPDQGYGIPLQGSVKGKIIENTDSKPLEYTSVALYRDQDSSLVSGAITAADGSFLIRGLSLGDYFLVANFMGYEKTYISEINLTRNNQNLDLGIVEMKPFKQDLKEVEVVGTQKRLEYKIDRKVINVSQDLNAAGGTAIDVLQNTPSVTVDIDGNVSLRGSTNFTVLIDGRPSPLAGNDALQQIPAASIQNIEIITNPSAKYEPDGMAGIINIVSKKNSLRGLSGIFNTTVGTGDKYSGNFLLNYKTKAINVFGGIDYLDNKYRGSVSEFREMYLSDSPTSLVSLKGSRDMFRNGLTFKSGIDFFIDESSILSVAANAGSRGRSFESQTRIHSYTFPASFDTFKIGNGLSSSTDNFYDLNLNYTRKFEGQGHELQGNISLQAENGDEAEEESESPVDEFYRNPLLPERVRSGESGTELEIRAKLDYTRPVFNDGFLETGYQMRLDKESEKYTFENYDPDTRIWYNNPDYSSGNYYFNNIQAGYATITEKIGKYEFKAGLRGEFTDRSIKKDLNSVPYKLKMFDLFPALHVSRQFAFNQQMMTSYSRRINRPNGFDLEPFRTYMNSYTLREGNPELKPEYVNSFELNYQKNFGKSYFIVESYYRNTRNLITRTLYKDPVLPDVVIMTSKNINEDNSLGGELMINLTANKWLNINTSFNIYKYWLDGTLNGEVIHRNSNNWDTKLNSSFYLSTKSRIQLNLMYNGPSVTAQGERGSFYFANIAYRQDFLDRKLSATLSLQDIFGTMKHEFTSTSQNLTNFTIFEREHQVLTLTLSYKLNNFKSQERKQEEQEINMEEGSLND